MKRAILSLSLIAFSFAAFSQSSINAKLEKADSLLKAGNTEEAYKIYKEAQSGLKKSDSIYRYTVWYHVMTTYDLAKAAGMKEDYINSLKYSLELLELIRKNKDLFDQKFAGREFWAIKDVSVAYFGLGKLDEANKYRAMLYKAYREKILPKGLEGYFNYDFFKLGGKNIWGYEWYPELPDDRFSGSFTKVVYYVYSTNPDGTDKEQLYRFHVLMFHQDPKKAVFDYILEKQIDTEEAEISGSYYNYVYKKDIDYKKLKQDIIRIVKEDLQPDTKRAIRKRKE